MSKALTKADAALALVSSLGSVDEITRELLQKPHYKKMGADGIYAVVTKAKALEIDVIDALNGALYCVHGRVGMSSELMSAMIRARGHSITKDPKSDESICILHGKRRDTGDTWTVSFGKKDADLAGLSSSDQYKKRPGIMYYNRAMSMLARQLFADVIKGAGYTLDELHEMASSEGSVDVTSSVEVKSRTLDEEQVSELRALLDLDPVYRDKFMAHLKLSYRIERIEDVPESMWADVIRGARRNAEVRKANGRSQLAPKEETVLSMSDLVEDSDELPTAG